MRKIEQQMLDAIRNRKDWKSGNTEVRVTYFPHGERNIERTNVYLHGNKIAEITPEHVVANNCGWKTPTTKSRLNAILYSLCSTGIFQHNHVWYSTVKGGETVEFETDTDYMYARFVTT